MIVCELKFILKCFEHQLREKKLHFYKILYKSQNLRYEMYLFLLCCLNTDKLVIYFNKSCFIRRYLYIYIKNSSFHVTIFFLKYPYRQNLNYLYCFYLYLRYNILRHNKCFCSRYSYLHITSFQILNVEKIEILFTMYFFN